MEDQLDGWVRATIDRMNDNPERARALLELADWPSLGEGFHVEHSGPCPSCGHPRIDVVEPGEGDTPVAVVTSGCLVCDVFTAVDLEEVDLVDWEELPEGTDPSDEDPIGN